MAEKRWIFWLSSGLLLAAFPLYYASMICFFNAKEKMESLNDNFGEMFDTWKSDLVFDLTNSETDRLLASNEYLVPWIGTFPGTIEGCYCKQNSTKYPEVIEGLKDRTCTLNEAISGCLKLSKREAKPIDKWYSDQKLFGIKIRDTAFINTVSNMNTDGTCKEGFIHCGDPTSSSKGICIPSQIGRCPISSILRFNSGDDTELRFGTLNFYISRDERKNPISDLNITESHLCMVRSHYPLTPNRQRYPLLLGNATECQKDETADKIGLFMGEKELFERNEIKFEGLYDYDVSNSYPYYLMAGRNLEWSPECIPLIDKTMRGPQKSNDLYKQYQILKVLLIISSILFFTAYCAAGVSMAGDNKSLGKVSYYLLAIAFLLIFPSYCIIMSRSSTFYNDYALVSSKKCSNEQTNNHFANLSKNFRETLGYLNNCFFWTGLVAMLLAAAGAIIYHLSSSSYGNDGAADTSKGNIYAELEEPRNPIASFDVEYQLGYTQLQQPNFITNPSSIKERKSLRSTTNQKPDYSQGF